jgi:tRNA pseudouridine55 synthase
VFGRETDTCDAAGRPVADTGRAPDADALAAAVARLPGRVLQTPPAFSAKKVGGEAAHRLARRDAAVTLTPVEVEILEAVLVAASGLEAQVRLTVSAGFYVRALARDLGRALGVGAHLGALRRTRAGAFGLDVAVPWGAVAAGGPALAALVIPLERLLPELPAARLTAEDVRRVRNGQRVVAPLLPGRTGPGDAADVRLLDPAGHLVGIAAPVAVPQETPAPGGAALLQPVVVLV